jgi:hypothetical protein
MGTDHLLTSYYTRSGVTKQYEANLLGFGAGIAKRPIRRFARYTSQRCLHEHTELRNTRTDYHGIHNSP